jgi:hypothetical protein
MDVYHPNDSFRFDKLQLSPPQHITGGSYMTRFSYCDSKQPLFIQTTKTLSKQGIVISGKKAYIDLLLTSNDSDSNFIEWITNLEKRSVDLLYEKRHIWFTQELDHTDIENSITSPLRAYKTGNFLLRINLEPARHMSTHTQLFQCKVFDENKKPVIPDYIKAEHTIISIIEFQGIKFTSRSFQLELLLRQVLVIPDIPLFETCVIRADSPPPEKSNITSTIMNSTPTDSTTNDYLGLLAEKEIQTKQEEEEEQIQEQEQEQTIDHTERYIETQAPLKHFECMEVDFDFNNIPDTIDVNEPSFEVADNIPINTNTNTPPSANMKSKERITLKKHKDVLYEMYKIAKHKALEMKRAAMRAYLEAKEIKAKYLLDDLDDLHSDNSDDDSKN